MTTKEKGDLVIYINYLRSKGEEARRKSRDPNLDNYMQAWLAGSGEMRRQVALELESFLDGSELEI